MSVKKFKFVSPGIFLNEIDNSQIPAENPAVGPVLIGRTERGPALRPVRIESFSEFVNVFGNPIAGGGDPTTDVWRQGNGYLAPTYATYAAQAYLRNNSPITMVRLLGAENATPSAGGEAGWRAGNGSGPLALANGGAYGLFMFDSGSTYSTVADTGTDLINPETGTLAAVWYFADAGYITLSGTYYNATGTVNAGIQESSSVGALLKSDGPNRQFTAEIKNASDATVKKVSFDFEESSSKYIRKVFNTNPASTNSAIVETTHNYWLGETYDKWLKTVVTGSTTGGQFGVVLPLYNAAGGDITEDAAKHQNSLQVAKSGWVFSQDLNTAGTDFTPVNTNRVQKLFRFHTLSPGDGDWSQKNLKISIQDIQGSGSLDDPYGSFTVLVRKANDTDNAVKVVESFTNCSLNPNSLDYVGLKVGDKYAVWDEDNRLYREYGQYTNNSRFIRVEVNTDVDSANTPASLLPFGFYGPPAWQAITTTSGSSVIKDIEQDTTVTSTAYLTGGVGIVGWSYRKNNKDISIGQANQGLVDFGLTEDVHAGTTLAIKYPEISMRLSASDGALSKQTDAYFGLETSVSAGSKRFGRSFMDIVGAKPSDVNSYDAASGITQYSTAFTLDDLVYAPVASSVYHQSGSRALGWSMTADSSSFQEVLDMGYDRFTMPLFGGSDGVDVTEMEPFGNHVIGASELVSYEYNTIKRAMDSVADPEVVEMNLASMPGLTNESLTTHLVNICEERADSLAVIDVLGGFVPASETKAAASAAARRGSVSTTIINLKNRGLNSSYGCAYYPWVQIRDNINSSLVWVPPSVAAIGVFGSSAAKSELWFAPAGFNRGGLTEGSAGIPVLNVVERVASKDRDKLYDANINPIASFPSEGIVVFGQKTLQTTRSALDRINVRRLLIYLKKEISRISATLLFDQNVQATWDRFLAQVNPFLASVKSRLGLMDYKVILDKTTTTPDLIDRNVLYAKILLKPAKAIEFIALDFVITDSGASFED